MQKRFRRSWLWATVLLAVVVGAAYLRVPPRISQANFKRIEIGMTDEEVRSVLGEPYTTYPPRAGPHTTVWKQWCDDDDNAIFVMLIDGLVTNKGFRHTDLSFVELMKRRLRARWP
jgi:hypothetical protein